MHPKHYNEVLGKYAKTDLVKGTPLNINSFSDDDEAYMYLDELLMEDFTLYLVTSGNDWLIVCTLPTCTNVRQIKKSHLKEEVICGSLGNITRNRLQEAAETHKVLQVEFSKEKFELLKSGQAAFTGAMKLK